MFIESIFSTVKQQSRPRASLAGIPFPKELPLPWWQSSPAISIHRVPFASLRLPTSQSSAIRGDCKLVAYGRNPFSFGLVPKTGSSISVRSELCRRGRNTICALMPQQVMHILMYICALPWDIAAKEIMNSLILWPLWQLNCMNQALSPISLAQYDYNQLRYLTLLWGSLIHIAFSSLTRRSN